MPSGDDKQQRLDPLEETRSLQDSVGLPEVQQFELAILEGPSRGRVWQSTGSSCSIGSHPTNDLVIEDATVSRFHCELRVDRRASIRDLESRNGTLVDGVSVLHSFLRDGSLVRLGGTLVRFQWSSTPNRIVLSANETFGSLVGGSVAMRHAFALQHQAAPLA